MSEFFPQTHWVETSQDAYDRAVAGSTSVGKKPVVEKGDNQLLRLCDSYTNNDNCINCSEVHACPVGKLVFRKNSSDINPRSYLS